MLSFLISINVLQLLQQVALESLRNRLERENEESNRVTMASMRLTIDSEWQEKIKVAVETAWRDSADLWQGKLATETDKLDTFKRDVTSQMTYMANERNELQEKLRYSSFFLIHTSIYSAGLCRSIVTVH